MKTDRLLKMEAVPLFYGAFLSAEAEQVMCVNKKTTEWVPEVTPKLRYWEGISLQVVQTDLLPKSQ
jgi:hypothetical protein